MTANQNNCANRAIEPKGSLRRLFEITLKVAAAPAGALAAFVLGKILAIALLLLRFFLRARSRLRSAFAPELGKVISTSPLVTRRRVRDSGFWTFVFIISTITASCEYEEKTMTRGFGGGDPSKTTAAASAKEDSKAEEAANKQVYSDDHFVESDLNRDPFRSFTALFKSSVAEEPQRTVIMATTAIENMKLIAIISGVPSPKAMLVDGVGVGHIVERGMYLGRPEIVRASENVSMTLNWRVHRIRENEVVLTRADPTDPNRPPLTRVIPLRENELVATR